MLIESSILSSAFASLSIVYTAYSKVKSNRERCGQLLERCKLVVDRLQAIVTSGADTSAMNGVKDLEHTFKLTADTITKVGQQGYIVSLLRSEENASLIEDSQHALSVLVSLLNLEQTIDISAWQRESEAARRRDHDALLAVGRKLEEGNAAILNELAQQGATLADLSSVVQSISASLGNTSDLPNNISSPLERLSALSSSPGTSRPRALSESSTRPRPVTIFNSESRSHTVVPVLSPPTTSPSSMPRNRMSWTGRLRSLPFSAVASRLSPRISTQTSKANEEQDAVLLSEPSLSEFIGMDSTSILLTPPPAYNPLPDELLLDLSDKVDNSPNAPDSDDASTVAVRDEDSPIPSPGSLSCVDCDKPLPNDPVENVRSASRNKDGQAHSISPASVGAFGKVNSRVMVEMWILPKSLKASNRAVPLDCFEPIQRNNLELVKQHADSIGECLRLLQRKTSGRAEYNHVLLLCPQETEPSVVVIKRRQASPQPSIKAYILESIEELVLVSVRRSKKVSWYLIPYCPPMRVSEAKQYIQRHFGNVVFRSCRRPRKASELSDDEVLSEVGVRAYAHGLDMKISLLL